MTDKVISLFPGVKSEEEAIPKDIYNEAEKHGVDQVVVIGLTKDKRFFINGNIPIRDGIYLMELGKKELLDVVMES